MNPRTNLNGAMGREYAVLLVLAGLCAWATPAHAALQSRGRVLPVDEMVRQADVVGVATVQSASPRLETRTGVVCTDFRLRFTDVWKGDPGNEFTLVKPGGEIQGQKTSVPGHEFILKPGDPVVVFASPSKLGNHNVIGLRQGLYRIGPGADQPLYRVSEHPLQAGASSPLKLQALKDEVSRALGRADEPSTTPTPSSLPALAERPPETPAAQIPAAPATNVALPPPSASSRTWGGLMIVALCLLVGIVMLLFRKNQALKR